MSDELIRLSATEAAAKLKAREITPLDLIWLMSQVRQKTQFIHTLRKLAQVVY